MEAVIISIVAMVFAAGAVIRRARLTERQRRAIRDAEYCLLNSHKCSVYARATIARQLTDAFNLDASHRIAERSDAAAAK